MAKSGFRHIDVGAELTKTEWESEESHELIHGTAFPASPVERQLFYRDDEHKWYIYNGSAWVDLQGTGGGGGDMLKSVYDTNDNSVVDNSEKLEGSTKLQVQDHTPKAHTLASHSTKDHSELTGVTADQHHAKTVSSEIDHGSVQGLADDDHPQYIKHSLATAVNNFLVASGAGVFIKKTLAEVKTLLNWAADIATHAGLTTGVHGVGSDYIAKSSVDGLDLASHATRHKWLGADELNIKDAFMYLNPIYIKGWENLDGFTASHTNSGAFTQSFGFGLLTTGAANGSRACVYETSGIYVYNTSPMYYTRFCLRVNQSTAPISKVAWFGLLDSPTAPTATQKHIAFKIVGSTIYASCGDGANGNLESTGMDITQYATRDLYFRQIGTNIYFYIDGVLKVTFTTYSPTSWLTARATLYVLNSAAEISTFKVWPLKMLSGAD